jgi:uncharacterized protein (UPF0276 family)
LLDELPPLALLEVSPENYIQRGGYHAESLAYLAEHYPIVSHGLTLSIGGVERLDMPYLRELARFVASVGSPWHSDHLCFGSVDGRVLHDLLPIGFTEAVARRVADRVRAVEDALGVPFALENISYYVHAGEKQMSEAEFIATVCDAADCGLMLDVNNAYVNATNFGFDLETWMRTVPLGRVVQVHLAGHDWFTERGELLSRADDIERARRSRDALIVDTHGASVADPVMDLFASVIARTGPVPVVLERDQDIPPLPVLMEEVAKIERVMNEALVAAREGRDPRVARL